MRRDQPTQHTDVEHEDQPRSHTTGPTAIEAARIGGFVHREVFASDSSGLDEQSLQTEAPPRTASKRSFVHRHTACHGPAPTCCTTGKTPNQSLGAKQSAASPGRPGLGADHPWGTEQPRARSKSECTAAVTAQPQLHSAAVVPDPAVAAGHVAQPGWLSDRPREHSSFQQCPGCKGQRRASAGIPSESPESTKHHF